MTWIIQISPARVTTPWAIILFMLTGLFLLSVKYSYLRNWYKLKEKWSKEQGGSATSNVPGDWVPPRQCHCSSYSKLFLLFSPHSSSLLFPRILHQDCCQTEVSDNSSIRSIEQELFRSSFHTQIILKKKKKIRIMTNGEVHRSTKCFKCIGHITSVHAWVLYPPNMVLCNLLDHIGMFCSTKQSFSFAVHLRHVH